MFHLHNDVGFATTVPGTGAQGDRGVWETPCLQKSEAVKFR